jgi:hypothetical protein
MTICGPETFGADPVRIKWNVVRGDSAPITVEFLQDDEKTYFDISDWTFKATAYDPKTDIIDELEVIKGEGYVRVDIHPSVSKYWGSGYSSVVSELLFDLQATIPTVPNDTIWTPIIGTLVVLGDVSGATL